MQRYLQLLSFRKQIERNITYGIFSLTCTQETACQKLKTLEEKKKKKKNRIQECVSINTLIFRELALKCMLCMKAAYKIPETSRQA